MTFLFYKSLRQVSIQNYSVILIKIHINLVQCIYNFRFRPQTGKRIAFRKPDVTVTGTESQKVPHLKVLVQFLHSKKLKAYQNIKKSVEFFLMTRIFLRNRK